ncbi:hypothetical protein [Winogradskyella undariae]|uniref:hypothetical protein n=1 Tax=Winogradskyella undariae TaxID=1285465 RepID=UPI0015C73C9D|nr:hypothetical protein [Winogradskyella undariae]QNK77740.1 hypothetical protein H7F37_01215 [Winogradskyella sp. PAMC22761]
MIKITKWLINLSPLQIGLLLILMPFIAGVVNGLIAFISIFLDSEFPIPLFHLSILIIHIIFMLWIWFFSVTINRKMLKINNTLFKICFLILFLYRLLEFMSNLSLDIYKKGWYLDHNIISFIEISMYIYTLLVIVSYIYLTTFTAKIMTKLSIEKVKLFTSEIPHFFSIFIFPIGIPLLQLRVQNYLNKNKLFGFNFSKKVTTKKREYQPTNKIEKKIKEQKNEINREDPSRFMPK